MMPISLHNCTEGEYFIILFLEGEEEAEAQGDIVTEVEAVAG